MELAARMIAPLRRADGDWRQALAASAPALVALLLVLVLAAQLASLLWRVLAPAADSGGDLPGAHAPQAPTAAVDLAAIVNAHLFGVAAVSGGPGLAPATTANLVLAGTLAGHEPERGWAIIGASAQAGRVYATGSTLPGGARLVAVYPDRVILERGGLRESLSLPRLSGAGGPAPVTYQQGVPQQAPSLVEGVRELLAQDPSAISEVMRPQPVFAGGQQRGYRVYPGRNRAQFARLGLQPGDLVTAVNGVPLDDPNRGLDTLRAIGMGGAVTLSIERNGQAQQLAIDSSNVTQELMPVNEPPQMSPNDATE